MALLLADHHHRLALEASEAADDRLVVAELAVALELDELVDQRIEIVDEMRPVGMAGHLGCLPGGKVGVGLAAQILHLPLQRGDVVVHAALAGAVRQGPKLAELGLQLSDGLLEFEVMAGGYGHSDGGAVREGRRLRREPARSQAQARQQRASTARDHVLRAKGCLVCTTCASRSSATCV